jgi:hypothetical protein
MENLVGVSSRGGSGWNWMILFTARSFSMIRAAAALTFSMSICGGLVLLIGLCYICLGLSLVDDFWSY